MNFSFAEVILAPIAPLTCNSNNKSITGNDENTLSVPNKISEAISEESSEVATSATSNNGSDEKPARFKIKKPWVTCLAENKKIWKEQAVKGLQE